MTPEKLNLYKRLQPVFFKEFLLKDRIYDFEEKQEGFIVEVPDERNNFFQARLESGVQIQYRLTTDNLILCPLPIDPVNPERGLWGMVDWKRFVRRILSDGKIEILIPEANICYIDDPETALLKALVFQEGK